MHSSMLTGAQLLWGFRSSPQSSSAELTDPITELQGTSSVPQQFVEVGQRRQAQLLGQFSQEQFPGHTASCRPAEGICLALAPKFFSSSCILHVDSMWHMAGCTRLLQSTSLGTTSCCSIQRLHGTIPAGQLFCLHSLHSSTSHTNREWRWQKGRVEDCRASPCAALK